MKPSGSSFVTIAVLACVLVIPSQLGNAQEAWDYLAAVTSPSFSGTVPVEFGYIDTSNGNLHLEIPVANPPQRGSLTYNARFVYDSRIWVPDGDFGPWLWEPRGGIYLDAPSPWNLVTDHIDLTNEMFQGWPTTPTLYASVSNSCFTKVFSNFEFSEGLITRFFNITITLVGSCGAYSSSADGYATDGSGYHLYVQGDISTGMYDYTVIAPDGTDAHALRDRNGNYISSSTPFIDTLGRTVVTVTGSSNPFVVQNNAQIYYDVLNSQGSTSRYIVTLGQQPVCTQFHQTQPPITEYCSGVSFHLPSSILLPDGTSYQFAYDSYGQLTSMTLPTGGAITYGYTNFTDAFGNVNRWVTSRTSAGGQWSYTPSVLTACQSGHSSGCTQQVKVLEPSNDYAVYQFSINGAPWLSSINYYSSGGSLLDLVTRTYDFSQPCSVCFGNVGYVHPTVQHESPTGFGTKQVTFSYDSPQKGNLTALKEWNFYQSSPGATPDRETDINYQTLTLPIFGSSGGPTFISSATIYKPSTVTTYASGTQVSQTLYSYDSTSLTSAVASNYDSSDYATMDTTRGNVTAVGRWVSGSSYLTTMNYYDTTGQMIKSLDPSGNPTQFSYSDAFYNDNNADPPATTTAPLGQTNAYLTQITLPASGSLTFGYYLGSGKRAKATDQNGISIYAHYADPLDRPTRTKDGAGGWVLNSYPSGSGSALQVDTYTGITDTSMSAGCTGCRHDQTIRDAWGRLTTSYLVNDPDGQIITTVGYDVNGRVSSVTNPYRSTADPTYGVTTTTYDGLNRVVQVAEQDGINTISIAIGLAAGGVTQSCSTGLGVPQLVTDEVGKQRLSWIDGFGRVVEVDEPNSSGALSVATCYQYNAWNKLAAGTQMGGTTNGTQWRTGSFSYDGLFRMTSAMTPEGGTTTYSYTTSGGGLCAGDPNAVCSVTDARPITTTFTYDALNRMIGKTYSDSTPAVSYYYDQASYNGLTIGNGRGRRTGMSDGSGQTAWSYDAAGRVIARKQTIGTVTNTTSYAHNFDGSVASITYPTGRTIVYQSSNAQRATTAIDNANGISYVSNAHYAAPGMLTNATYGQQTGWNAITLTDSFNNRLQLTGVLATSTTF